jgi:hypothetical protein
MRGNSLRPRTEKRFAMIASEHFGLDYRSGSYGAEMSGA